MPARGYESDACRRSVGFVEGVAPGRARSGSLGSRASATNTAAAYLMYLHDALSDDVYVRVVEKLAEVAREDASRMRRPALRRIGSSTRGRR